jgi:hypothetical protein
VSSVSPSPLNSSPNFIGPCLPGLGPSDILGNPPVSSHVPESHVLESSLHDSLQPLFDPNLDPLALADPSVLDAMAAVHEGLALNPSSLPFATGVQPQVEDGGGGGGGSA